MKTLKFLKKSKKLSARTTTAYRLLGPRGACSRSKSRIFFHPSICRCWPSIFFVPRLARIWITILYSFVIPKSSFSKRPFKVSLKNAYSKWWAFLKRQHFSTIPDFSTRFVFFFSGKFSFYSANQSSQSMSVSDTSLTERRKIVKEKVLSRVCCFSTFVDVDWEVAERFWSGATLQCHWSRKKATSQKYDQQQCSWESSWDTKRFSNAWMFIVDSLSRIIFFSSRKKLWNLKYFWL